MQIVERLKEKCKEKHTTMGTLERELQLGNGTIRRWDEKTPSADKVLAVANRLEVSVDWLLTGKESGELTAEEQKLINLYRTTDNRGKKNIMRTAEAEADNGEQTDQISTSKIG